MKKIKKILSLTLAVTMLSAMIGVIPVSADTVAISEWRAGFNNIDLPLNGGWSNSIWDQYSCGIFNTYEHGLYYAPAKFGKSEADAALHLSKESSFYALRGSIADIRATSVRIRFQMATDNGGGGGLTINGSWSLKNAPSLGGDFLFGVVNGYIYIMGQKTDVAWVHEKWHDIDIVVTLGDNSEVTVVVDGEPVRMGIGKTFDGVKSTAWRLPVIAGIATAGDADSYFRLNTYGGNNGFYIDNWILQGTNNGILEADGKLFKSPTTVLSSSTIDQLPVANLEDGAKTLKDRPGDADGDNAYLELNGPGGAYIYRDFATTGGQSTFRSDIMYSRAIEMNTFSGKTDVILELDYPHYSYLMNGGFGNGNYIGEAPKAADAQKSLPSDNAWHDFEWIVDNDGDGRGECATLNAYFDGMPQNRCAGVYGSSPFEGMVPHQLRIGFGSAWGVDNMRETLMKYKPHIKSATYTTAAGNTTDDYAVSADVEKITVELTETIAAANDDTVKLYDANGNDVGAAVTLLEDNKTIELTLSNALAHDTNYSIALLPELVCEDSNTDAGAWYQTLDTTEVYDFKTSVNPFDWKRVALMTSFRTGEGTEESPYVWTEPAEYSYGYIGDNSRVGVKVTMNNISGEDKPAYVIVATYLNDTLTRFAMVPYTFTAENTTATVMTDAIPNTANMKIKAFVWDSADFGVPYTKSFHLYSWNNETGSFAGGTPIVNQ